MKSLFQMLVAFLGFLIVGSAYASIIIPMYEVDTGKKIGTVKVEDTAYGLLFTPNLTDLAPGAHGFHIHEMPSCNDHAMAAGGHLDPDKTNHHKGPFEKGHLGDLPALFVDKDGKATIPVLAPRLKLDEIEGHSLMIHAGSDNYADIPEKLGGGGARVACGVITNEH